jgi:hypothetical protein
MGCRVFYARDCVPAMTEWTAAGFASEGAKQNSGQGIEKTGNREMA